MWITFRSNFFKCWGVDQQSADALLLRIVFYFSSNFNRAISEQKKVLHCVGYDYEGIPDDIMEAPFPDRLFFYKENKNAQ